MEKIEEEILELRRKIYREDLPPERAAELLNRAASLYGSILEELKKAQMIYNKIYASFLVENSATKAKIISETTEEFEAMLNHKNQEKTLLQIIASLKYFLRTKENEEKISKHI